MQGSGDAFRKARCSREDGVDELYTGCVLKGGETGADACANAAATVEGPRPWRTSLL